MAAPLDLPGLSDLAEIGRGGYGVVYRAWQEQLRRPVAVKVLTAVLDVRFARRFAQECQTLGMVSGHPHIVAVHDAGTTPTGKAYLVMGFCEGGSMLDRIESDGPMPWQEVLDVGVRLCGALQTAHNAGILHRDIKPANILVDAYGAARLADFGQARQDGTDLTRTGELVVTPGFAAPEVLHGKPAGARADVYSLATTLMGLLLGHGPFAGTDGEHVAALLLRVVTEPAPDLRGKGIPDEFCTVLERAMDKDLDNRPRTAADLGEELRDVQRRLGVAVSPLALAGKPPTEGPTGLHLSGPMPTPSSTLPAVPDPPSTAQVPAANLFTQPARAEFSGPLGGDRTVADAAGRPPAATGTFSVAPLTATPGGVQAPEATGPTAPVVHPSNVIPPGGPPTAATTVLGSGPQAAPTRDDAPPATVAIPPELDPGVVTTQVSEDNAVTTRVSEDGARTTPVMDPRRQGAAQQQSGGGAAQAERTTHFAAGPPPGYPSSGPMPLQRPPDQRPPDQRPPDQRPPDPRPQTQPPRTPPPYGHPQQGPQRPPEPERKSRAWAWIAAALVVVVAAGVVVYFQFLRPKDQGNDAQGDPTAGNSASAASTTPPPPQPVNTAVPAELVLPASAYLGTWEEQDLSILEGVNENEAEYSMFYDVIGTLPDSEENPSDLASCLGLLPPPKANQAESPIFKTIDTQYLTAPSGYLVVQTRGMVMPDEDAAIAMVEAWASPATFDPCIPAAAYWSSWDVFDKSDLVGPVVEAPALTAAELPSNVHTAFRRITYPDTHSFDDASSLFPRVFDLVVMSAGTSVIYLALQTTYGPPSDQVRESAVKELLKKLVAPA